MNRTKRPVTSRLAKKMKKEVRNASTRVEDRAYADQLTSKEMLKKFPKKTAAKKKAPAATKTAGKKGVSKRTTPGSVPSTSTPAYAKKEGGRWAKTLTKQSQIQRKSLQKKLSKKR